MAVTASLYGMFLDSMATKKVDLATDTIVVQLLTSSYTPNVGTDQYQSTTNADEVSGTGYTAGGAALAGVTLSVSSAGTLTLAADNVTWASSTITAAYAVLVDTTPGTAATNPLIGYIDFGGSVSSSDGPFEINWSGGDVLQITV